MERWLTIRDFPRYSISDEGNVRNETTGRLMSQVINPGGVHAVYLVRDGKQYSRGVAKLVATHFLPHATDLHNTPLHRDGDRGNNRADNLIYRPRWYSSMYLRQFEDGEFRPPFVNKSIVETQTGQVFRNSWEAAKHFGVLEREIARSYHIYHGQNERVPASPTNYYFQRYDS